MLAVMRALPILLLAAACGSGHPTQLYPAGSDKDDGYGDLAQKSSRLLTADPADPSPFAPRRGRRHAGDPYGGNPYGGTTYGGDPYAGAADPSAVPSGRGL